DNDPYSVSVAWQTRAALLPPSSRSVSPLVIVKAEYGAQDKWLDITEIARKAVRDGQLRLRADNTLGPDPVHGVVKSLRVTYDIGGKEQRAVASENQEILIDAAPDRYRYTLKPDPGESDLSFVCAFAPKDVPKRLPSTEET